MSQIKLLDEPAFDDPLFKDDQFDRVVGTATEILIARGQTLPASLLANGDLSVRHLGWNDWNGGQNTWRLNVAVPVATFCTIDDRQAIATMIDDVLGIPAASLSDSDFFRSDITPQLENDRDWRQKARRSLAGEGITNQGRAHSENVATKQFDNLLFRSGPEILLYRALKATSVAFAPLPVVVGRDGIGQRPKRIEPDFVIFKDGLVTIVEIDGDRFHSETPHAAYLRLKFLSDEGPSLQRINAAKCDTEQKAREAAEDILAGIEKRRKTTR